MRKILFLIMILLFLIGCGSGSSSSDTPVDYPGFDGNISKLTPPPLP